MFSTPSRGPVVPKRKRTRKRYDLARRIEVARTRELGACPDCRRRKVRCDHAQGHFSAHQPVLPVLVSEALSPQLVNNFTSPLSNGAADYDQSGLELHGNCTKGMGSLDSRSGDNTFIPVPGIDPLMEDQTQAREPTVDIPSTTLTSLTSPFQGVKSSIATISMIGGDFSTSREHQSTPGNSYAPDTSSVTALDYHFPSQPFLPVPDVTVPEASNTLARRVGTFTTTGSWTMDGAQSHHYSKTLYSTMNFNQAYDSTAFGGERNSETDLVRNGEFNEWVYWEGA